jgi:hypothetical protein
MCESVKTGPLVQNSSLGWQPQTAHAVSARHTKGAIKIRRGRDGDSLDARFQRRRSIDQRASRDHP